MFVDRPTDAAAYKLHQLFRLKPAVPHVVTLPLDDFQFDFSAKFSISLSQQGRILIERNDFVLIAMKVKNGNVCIGKWSESINRVVLDQIGLELFGG